MSAKAEEQLSNVPQFSDLACWEKKNITRDNKDNKYHNLHLTFKKMPRYLSLDIICLSDLSVFHEVPSRRAVHFSEQFMSA